MLVAHGEGPNLCHTMNRRSKTIGIEPLQHSTYKVFAAFDFLGRRINRNWANLIAVDIALRLTIRKPFDVLAEGLLSEESGGGGNRTRVPQ